MGWIMCDDCGCSRGILYGIGVGSGDPELLTLKAGKILEKVDIIFAPKPEVESTSTSMDIIKKYIQKKEVKELIFPMTKDRKKLEKFWKKAAMSVYEKLSSGKDAAFITIGDPFIYSTYIYLLRYIRKLDENVKVVTIPGISAINASSSLLGVPLAEGNEKFAVMPLPEHLEELKTILSMFDTVVLLKIGKSLNRLVKFLKEEGLDKTSFFVRQAGLTGQYIAKDLSSLDVDGKTPGYLSTMIIKCKER